MHKRMLIYKSHDLLEESKTCHIWSVTHSESEGSRDWSQEPEQQHKHSWELLQNTYDAPVMWQSSSCSFWVKLRSDIVGKIHFSLVRHMKASCSNFRHFNIVFLFLLFNLLLHYDSIMTIFLFYFNFYVFYVFHYILF